MEKTAVVTPIPAVIVSRVAMVKSGRRASARQACSIEVMARWTRTGGGWLVRGRAQRRQGRNRIDQGQGFLRVVKLRRLLRHTECIYAVMALVLLRALRLNIRHSALQHSAFSIQHSTFNIQHSPWRMHKTAVLNVVGLTPSIVGASMPALARWAAQGATARIKSAFPALTCSAQSDYLTGRYPDTHGIVGNGWYSREDAEIRFWKQSNMLVRAPKIWETARAADPSFTCANLFWWFNMYSTADYSVTPRPMYPADGRKIPDVYTAPGELRDELQSALGAFPLFEFWVPRAGIRSTEWIAAAAKHVDRRFNPTLTLLSLPHLDYNLQRFGPGTAAVQDLRQIDAVVDDLIRHYESSGARVIVLSEFFFHDVSTT